jgi:D-alanyl-lipoteichoic acid acyltransferase DltB (MBOAT superfamily)
MTFNSFTFIIFFAIVLSLYYLPFKWRTHKIILLVASYVFYGAWNPPFLLLLWLTTVMDWLCARWIERAERLSRRRLILVLSLISNLGMLSFFKYGNFFLENFVAAAHALGLDYRPAAPSIILPIGISFYTFESLSYTIDVYRRQIHARTSLLDFGLFVSFFPHLVAGPIMRAGDFLPQLETRRRATSKEMGWVLTLLCVGLFEKVVIADTLMAPIVDMTYAATDKVGFFSSWTGALAFSMQIFFDFAGYSTCAIGAALCFGFKLMKNFYYPLAAVSPQEFWTRWHISLTTWFRDYVFMPLARLRGRRVSRLWLYFSITVTMLLSGLWHGAAWKFVMWGGFQAVFFISERVIREGLKKRLDKKRLDKKSPFVAAPVFVSEGGFLMLPCGIITIMLVLLTFGLNTLALVFFRAPNVNAALHVLGAMFVPVGSSDILRSAPNAMTVLIVTTLTLLGSWKLKNQGLVAFAEKLPAWVRSAALGFIIVSVLACMLTGDDSAFIYFQF